MSAIVIAFGFGAVAENGIAEADSNSQVFCKGSVSQGFFMAPFLPEWPS